MAEHEARYTIKDDPIALGHVKQLRGLRVAFGMRQRDLGDQIGVSSQSILIAETHPEKVSVKMYNRFAEHFGWPKFTPPGVTLPSELPVREHKVRDIFVPSEVVDALMGAAVKIMTLLEEAERMTYDECEKDA